MERAHPAPDDGILDRILHWVVPLVIGLALLAAMFGTGSESLTAWPALFALCGSAMVLALRKGTFLESKASAACIWSLVAFAGYTFWRGANSEVAWIARFDMLYLTGAVATYLLVVCALRSTGECLTVVHFLMAAIVINVACALVQKFGNPTFSLHGYLAEIFPPLGKALGWTGMTRKAAAGEVAGLFASENHFSGFLACLAFIPLALAVVGRADPIIRGFYFLVFFVAGLGVVLSASRGGLLALGSGGLAFLVFTFIAFSPKGGRRARKRVGLVVGVAVALLAIGFAAYMVLKKEYTGGVFQNMSMRGVHWKAAFEQFLLSPITGTGARSFEYYERTYRSLGAGEWFYWSTAETDAYFAHGDWPQLLADYGAMGAILATLVMGSHLLVGVRGCDIAAREYDASAVALRIGALCGLIAAATHAVFEFNMHIFVLAITAAFLLGVLARRDGRASVSPGNKTRWTSLALRAGTICAGIWLVVMGRDWWKAEVLSAAAERQMQTGEYESTVALISQIQELDPENYLAPFTHGLLDYGAALNIQIEKIANTPEMRAQRNLMTKMRQGFLNSAAVHFARVHQLYPQNPHHSQYYAEVLSLLGRWPEADAAVADALKWGNHVRSVKVAVADILLRKAVATRDDVERISCIKEAIRHCEEVGDRYKWGTEESLGVIKRMDSAKAWLQALTSGNPPLSPALNSPK